MTRVCGCLVGKIKRKRKITASGWRSREEKVTQQRRQRTGGGHLEKLGTHCFGDNARDAWEVTITAAGKCWIIVRIKEKNVPAEECSSLVCVAVWRKRLNASST